MASLRARHSLKCALSDGLKVGLETTAPTKESEKIPGCTCKPTYAMRAGGKYMRLENRRSLREALRQLHKRHVQEDEGQEIVTENIKFAEWGELWLEQLERDPNTIRGYRSTITYATKVFGGLVVRKIGPSQIAQLLVQLREEKASRDPAAPAFRMSDSTRAKYLRVLGACFASAIERGYAGRNPVKALPKAEKPRASSREAAYFDNAELAKLFPRIPGGLWRTLFLTALKTGMREGELVGLTWGDIDLTAGHISVRRSYTGGRLGETKSRERRTVDVDADVVQLLGAWWGESGKPGDSALVFPHELGGGYIPEPRTILNVLYGALELAEVARVGQTGEKRTFHSFRHNYAKTALETGRPITWLSRQLGHSNVVITDKVYGHFERSAAKLEAGKMQGAFPV
jgi:integrase